MRRFTLTVLAALLSLEAISAAQNRARLKLSAVEPAEVYPGDTFDIRGFRFGDRQGPRAVIISGEINGRSALHKLRVLKWLDNRIRVDTSETVSPGRYTVGIYGGDETRLLSNVVSLTVLGGMVISRVNPDVAAPGDMVEIEGRHFTRIQGNRIVSINQNGRKHRLEVSDWSDTRIRARVPAVSPGRYLLLIYYDDTLRSSSDSYRITVEGSS
jgi:hypothetical protein